MVLGLLVCSISSAATYEEFLEKKEQEEKIKISNMNWFEKQIYKYKKEKRKKEDRKAYCAEVARSAKSDFAAKKIYKACMDD